MNWEVIGYVLGWSVVLSGIYWWVPKYVPQSQQEITSKWLLASMSMLAVILSSWRDIALGEYTTRLWVLISLFVIATIVGISYMYGYIPRNAEEDQVQHDQEFVLIIYSVILTGMNLTYEFIRYLYPYVPPVVSYVAGKRRK